MNSADIDIVTRLTRAEISVEALKQGFEMLMKEVAELKQTDARRWEQANGAAAQASSHQEAALRRTARADGER